MAWIGTAVSKSLVEVDFTAKGEPVEYIETHGRGTFKVMSQTYYSQGIPLSPGQMVFTNPLRTPIPKPSGNFSILGVVGDIVKDGPDGDKVPAPLSELYDHHWIVEDLYHKNELCQYGPNYVFGIGAESRNSPLHFPKGTGYSVADGTSWGGNIHLLRTDGGASLAGDDPWLAAKECDECYYDAGGTKGPKCTLDKNGTFECCGEACYDGSCSCPTKQGIDMTPVTYFLRYTMNYTYDVSAITPVSVGVITTPNCLAFYGVYRDDSSPESLSTTSFPVPEDGEILLGQGHLHTGAINMSMFVNDVYVCSSYPTYGQQEGVAGDELGHLVTISPCYTADDHDGQGYLVKKGDTIRLDAYYWVGSFDPRIAPTPGGTHLNVMAYMYMAYKGVADATVSASIPPLQCQRALRNSCKSDIGNEDGCLRCAHQFDHELAAGNCSSVDVSNACKHMLPVGYAAPAPSAWQSELVV
eukprot:CAMPEP_0194485052 /NCGR_PEP_ID=MMETSP0253-20130528/6170_1 /TAXON_ID=2966 /ORGANISM="Noctiluca scintillans" /LENGTH=468 /DNA_ID=CAMNT_0039324969 /DNA_START=46 /DNA_END=1452 /DNA_ORIENTATION=+